MNLESFSLWQRILIAAGIVLLVCMILLTLTRILGEAEAQQERQLCVSSDTERERIRTILLRAIDIALRNQIEHLFEVWMKDYTDKNSRAAAGARNAINAHVSARSHAQKWDPPLCT